jgi:DNA ligase (NAD+)
MTFDVVPQIESLVLGQRPYDVRDIVFPSHCTECHLHIEQIGSGATANCTGRFVCGPHRNEAIKHFASRKAFDIDGVGDTIVEQFVGAGLIESPADLFRLMMLKLISLERMGNKPAVNLLNALDRSGATILLRYIYSWGIREVEKSTARNLALHYMTLAEIMQADTDSLKEVQDVGAIVAEHILHFMLEPLNLAIINDLIELGIHSQKSSKHLGMSNRLQEKRLF